RRLPPLHPDPAVHAAATAGLSRPARPDRRSGRVAPARRAARRCPSPPRRPLRAPPLRRDWRPLRPRFLGASRVGLHAPHSSPIRRFVIGTAGHIDHGKTALVKALTGVDTDRWEEEKRRGITIDLVRSELSERLKTSRVRWEDPVTTSAVTGEGLDGLRAVLRRVAEDLIERPAADLFRLPIDRVFAVAGAGTVVTGSTWSGTVAVGDVVRLLPLEREARVRSIEVHSQAADRAVPGRRTALALVGVDKSELARGHVVVTGAGWRATTMLDAAVEL